MESTTVKWYGRRLVHQQALLLLLLPTKDTRMNVEKETIFHFTCQECKGWFSIATMEEWKPTKLYCPHCGIKNDIENNLVILL